MSLPPTREHVPSVIDTASNVEEEALYRMSKVLPLSGSQTATMTSSGGETITFELPNEPYNLSRSYLGMTLTPAAAGTGKYIWMHQQCLAPIRSISLYTRSGVYVADVQNVSHYTNSVRHLLLKYLDVKNNTNDNVASTSVEYGQLNVKDSASTASIYVISALGKAGLRTYSEGVNRIYIGGANGATPTANVRIPLRELLHTFFSQDKDMFFNQIMQLKVVFEPVSKVYWTSTSATDPTASAAAYTSDVAVSSIDLHVAIQKNENLRNALIGSVLTTGVSYVYPWVWTFKQSLTGTSQSTILKFNRSHGKALKMVFTSLANATESSNTCYDISTVSTTYGTDKGQSVVAYLNGQRLQDENLTPALEYDFLKAAGKIRDTVAHQNRGYYYINYAHVDDWSKSKSLADVDWNDDSGLELSADVDYNLQWTTASGTWLHYQFAICSRVLNVSAAGVAVF